MKHSDTHSIILKILLKYNIARIAKISEKSLSAFADSVILDIDYSIYNVRKIPYEPKSYILKILIIFFGITISNITYILKGCKSVLIDYSRIKYIFLPFSDLHFIRFKNIPDIMSNDYLMIYPPAFHIRGIIKHRDYFNKLKIPTLTPRFGFINSLKFLFYSIKYYRDINSASNEIEIKLSLSARNSLQSGICISIIYQIVFKNILRSISKQNSSKIIWFFDFDKDYKYISLNSEIKRARKTDNTVHIQHGLFFNNQIAYTYPNADYIFCCNKREKKIITNTIADTNRVIIVGAPLQCIEIKNENNTIILNDPKFQFIVLLSETTQPSFLKFQSEILSYLRLLHSISYCIRLRPSSKDVDLIRFGESIDHTKISSYKSLSEDLALSSVVISFSYDALIECFKQNKPILLGNDKNEFIYEGNTKDLPLHVFNNLSEFKLLIESETTNQSYSATNNSFINNNFGEFDFNKVKKNYLEAIKSIENSL